MGWPLKEGGVGSAGKGVVGGGDVEGEGEEGEEVGRDKGGEAVARVSRVGVAGEDGDCRYAMRSAFCWGKSPLSRSHRPLERSRR